MTPERWGAVCAAFDRVVELPEERREAEIARLREADKELADEVLSLLAAEQRSAGGLDELASAPDGRRGERVGVWQLLVPIGAGGMGEVYLARRADRAFEKLVAVKFVRPELVSPLVRARFDVERRTLATLEHPGIARLLDGGADERGDPFLVLEYVEGSTLLEHVASRALDERARLGLFLQILDAVAYAHRHLVVHRDLKPDNVLVTGEGRAKLLDFGIAKILDDDSESAGGTRTLLRALTPEYASPEQLSGGRTTTATDVYALGVVLRRLLAAAAADSLPQRRAPGRDLEAIVAQATGERPEERYATVDAFAADVASYLDGRPVAARRAGALYRLRKFARRHRAALAVAGIAAAALAATITISGVRLRRERDRAEAEAESARQVAGFLAGLFQGADPIRTRGAKLTAREILDQGAARIDRELAGQPVAQAELLTVLGAVERDLGLLEPARAHLERALALREPRLASEPLALAATLQELGSLDRIQNRLDDGAAHLERALALRRAALPAGDLELARTLSAFGLVRRMQGDIAHARPLLEEALAIGRAETPQSSETGRWLNHLGLVLQDGGDLEGARLAFTESLSILEKSDGPDSPLPALPLDNLAAALQQLGRPQESLPLLERALALVERTWGMGHPQRGNALNSLGAILSKLGRKEEAIEKFDRAVEVYSAALGPEHPYVAWPLRNKAEALIGLGRPREALPLFERALAIRRAAEGEDHPDTAQSLTDMGLVWVAIGDLPTAERWLRDGLAKSRTALEPGSQALAEAIEYLADVLARQSRPAEAEPLFREALGIYEHALPATDPRIAALRARLAGLKSS